MTLARAQRAIAKLKKSATAAPSPYANINALEQNVYVETPEYPPIQDLSLPARKQREKQHVYNKIQKLNTVEEKQLALNMPRYYGFKCVIMNEDKFPYNAMPLVQHYTRTRFIGTEKLPEAYNYTQEDADLVVKEIKSQIEDAICIENEGVEHNFPIIPMSSINSEPTQKENALSKCIAKQVNRIITNNLADKVSHILSAQIDYDPRHEAFWFVGGVNVPANVVRWRFQYPWLRGDRLYEKVDKPVQYIGNPMLAIRSTIPLQPLVAYSEADNPDFKIPNFEYHPQTIGLYTEHRHGTNIPGFWPGDRDEFGLLSIHGRGHLLERPDSYGEEDNIEALHCQAMAASFGWLLGQANYLGFTTYNDITFPLVTQTLITNGKLWSLYAYQLNTVEMHVSKVDENPKHNICFGTKPQMLYETIENGQVKGLNEGLLKMIVQLYLNAPEERDYNMKPYLGEEEQVAADIEMDVKRCWLENTYKHIVSNRPKHALVPEIYHWEQIYKIKHNTRFFERKVRPFERGINPFKRRLDEHLPPYIPKALRPYPRHKKKFESTYYPDV